MVTEGWVEPTQEEEEPPVPIGNHAVNITGLPVDVSDVSICLVFNIGYSHCIICIVSIS